MLTPYDLIVVGGGAAGLVTAAGAAGLGARVALIERHRLGGECLWTGCVPSKALLACARAAADARSAGKYGVHVANVTVDFAEVMAHVRRVQETIEPNDSPERFRGLGVDVIEGTARFVGDRTVRVDERTGSARHVVIATGSRPLVPNIPGLSDVDYHTNETIFSITEQPASLIVLGGGPIGVELAHAFALLGTEVTLLEAAERILIHEEAELAEIVAAELRAAGITLHVGQKIERVAAEKSGIAVTANGTRHSAYALLVAVGREAIIDTLDLNAGHVEHKDGALVLDDKLRTTAKNVWAAGDVTGAPRFTHVADYQARTVLRNALFPLSTSVNYDVVPRVTYTLPELASVGLTEAAARERHGANVGIWTRDFGHLDRAIADGHRTGMLKIVSDSKGRILGGHVLGHHASSIIAEIALAMRENVPLSRIAATLHAYPTYTESFKQAADGYMRSRFSGLAKSATNWLVKRM